jgi:hypothetical protein
VEYLSCLHNLAVTLDILLCWCESNIWIKIDCIVGCQRSLQCKYCSKKMSKE